MEITKITNKLSDKDISQLAKELGYNSAEIFQKTYQKFQQSQTLKNWLQSGSYDSVNTTESFVSKLAKIADIDIEQDIVAAKEFLMEKEKFKNSYILAVTDFNRQNQSIFSMMADFNNRRLSLYSNAELLFKTDKEILDIMPRLISQHYNMDSNNILGNILYYEAYLPFGKYKFEM
ncbi:hypothetical protein LA02_1000 [Francisella philomiragia]|uniref:hypothetical protein n=1 Tax=Francisella philomiragia TaxID=28110 RepID=UPI0005A570E4|nr:hypothetical protein [Francisella philomiragia]AJI56206.1 hypothetical protein LA02_1000 [Francisella philomiragia]